MNPSTLSMPSRVPPCETILEDETEPTQADLDECERLVQSLDLIELLQSEEA